MLTKKIILNPDYGLVNDEKRIIITYTGSDITKSFLQFIHPVHAQLFTFFTGEKTLAENLIGIEKYFGINKENAIKLIQPLINNEKDRYISFAGSNFCLPKNLLLSDTGLIRKDLSIEDVKIEGELDFETLRLNKPLNILFVINTKCYTNCTYCYADRCTRYNTLSTKRIVELIREMKNIGVRQLDISGGEFFLQQDWDIIAKTIVECGFSPDISTKCPISREDIDRFMETGLNTLQISLDSLDNEVLKRTIGIPDQYIDNLLDSIRYMDKKGMEVIIKPTLCKETCTVENVSKIIDFVDTLKNVKRCIVSIIGHSHFKPLNHFHKIKPDMQKIREVEAYINNRKSFTSYNLMFDSLPFLKSELCSFARFKNRSVCSANVHGFVILPDGQATICEELYWNPDFVIGDLKKNSIMEVWKSSTAFNLWRLNKKAIPQISECAHCNDFDNCRMKRGVCWKFVIAAYGKENRFHPDPCCPKAPMPTNEFFYNDCLGNIQDKITL